MSATVSPPNKNVEHPTPAAIMDAAFAFQRTFALKAALECDLFTAIGEGNVTASQIAAARSVSEKGARVICDFLTTIGFLTKEGNAYGLAPDAAMFLDRRSQAYLGSAIDFLASNTVVEQAMGATQALRNGTIGNAGSMAPEHEIWPLFARAMGSFMFLPAMLAAQLVSIEAGSEAKVLDIAAGHGEYGFAVARRFPNARIVAADWAPVLAIARERAVHAGLGDRLEELPGDAFSVDFGKDYDVVLIPNFIHHFDEATNVKLLNKVAAALKPGGQVVIVDFVPNEDRVSPPVAARFPFTMLTSTQGGDAFTASEYDRMLRTAGFTGVEEARPLMPTPLSAVSSHKKG